MFRGVLGPFGALAVRNDVRLRSCCVRALGNDEGSFFARRGFLIDTTNQMTEQELSPFRLEPMRTKDGKWKPAEARPCLRGQCGSESGEVRSQSR